MPAQAERKRAAVLIENASPDENFAALRDASRRGDINMAEALAVVLADYDIPSYVDYYRLKPRLKDLQAPASEVLDYLNRYQGSAIADRLRNDWLLELGRAGDWTTFDVQYPQFVLDDDTSLKCYALMSAASKGQDVAARARELLVSPRDYGQACPNLIALLAQNGQFNAGDVWQQISYAFDAGNLPLARRISVFTDAQDGQLAQAFDKPAVILKRGPGADAASHQLYILALARAARTNLGQATASLAMMESQLDQNERALAWAAVGVAAARTLDPQANDYLRRSYGATLSPDGYEWRARAALRTEDWPLVRRAIESMPQSLRDDDTWIYWMARASQAQHPAEAERLYRRIATHVNFYGQLATEALGRKVVADASAAPVTTADIAKMAINPGFQRSLRFFSMNMRFEAIREWNWELRSMDDRQLFAAAEFARQNDILDRMVNTSDRTRTEINFAQRYPTPHLDIMQLKTEELGLDIALVYGLMRQESRFMKVVKSSAGASGLMQIMPATASYVARKIGMTGFTADQITDIDTNITLGTNYISMVLGNLENSETLASAGYNAGPGRPRMWRSTLTKPIEGAIFAETIPFNETRGYVKNVLSNATYYAAMFSGQPQSLRERLGVIVPEGYTPPDLP